MCALAPGEKRILKNLKDGEKRFKDLYKTCVKNPNLLSTYLRHLQKTGLIRRNIDTRGFQLTIPGWESLYLADIVSLIENSGLRKENRLLLGFDVFISEEETTLQQAKKEIHCKHKQYSKEVLQSFSTINQFLFHVCKNQALAFFSDKDTHIIQDYERAFSEAASLTISPEERITKEAARDTAMKKLKQRYPGINIPASIVKLETEIVFQKLVRNEARSIGLEISNTKKLLERLNSSSSLSAEDKARLKPLKEILQDNRKESLYKRYLKSLEACPKMLVIFSSLAFNDYLKKQWKFFPEEEEAFREKHPWLYNHI